MRFPYREYVSQLPGTTDYRLILRPVITIRIVGPKSEARWDALVDTGADETILPLSLADLLGVELDQVVTSQAVGISGDKRHSALKPTGPRPPRRDALRRLTRNNIRSPAAPLCPGRDTRQ